MITAHETALWNRYLDAEARATREQKLATLESFVSQISSRPLAEWQQWAFELAEAVVDYKADLQVRVPLFRRVVFPALFDGYSRQKPNCARWLAGFSQLLYKCRDCQRQLPESAQFELGLLRDAIRHDPADSLAGDRLIYLLADRLRYTLHEVPTGVLYGIDGATPDQCLELEAELEEFITLTKQREQFDRFSALIGDCRFHYKSYRDYLLAGNRLPSYAAYLASRNGTS